MPDIPVVENPRRRRRRRRTFTAKQRAYGFGGGRRRRRTTRRRRNPALAALVNPRRTTRRRRYYAPTRRYRRRRNAGLRFGRVFRRFDMPAAGWTMAGLLGTRMLPGMIQRVPFLAMLPTMGPMGLLTKAATVALLGWGVGQFVGNRQAQHVVNGGLGALALELWDQYIGPQIGMGGFVSTDELYKVTGGVDGFVPAPPVVDGLGYNGGYDPAMLSA